MKFIDLEESTLISKEMHRQFFHCFLDYSRYDVSPASAVAA